MTVALTAGALVREYGMETDRIPRSIELSRDTEQEFITAHQRRVFLLIYRVVGNVADAQDLTQDAFVKALSRREQLKDDQKAAQWLGRIAYNTAIDFVRQRRRVSFCELEAAPEPQALENPERQVLRAEKQAYLADGLRLLSERERAALILRDVEGLPGPRWPSIWAARWRRCDRTSPTREPSFASILRDGRHERTFFTAPERIRSGAVRRRRAWPCSAVADRGSCGRMRRLPRGGRGVFRAAQPHDRLG